MAETNPNGANQYSLDPRQKLCWGFYVNPASETFSNGYQSAMKAGYSESHAATITTEEWFQDRVRRASMLSKAEKVLYKTLTYSVEEEGKVKTDLLRIQTDVAKHITDRLGKNEGYTTRNELTGADGKDLIPESSKEAEELAKKLNELQEG